MKHLACALLVFAVTLGLVWGGYCLGRSDAQHDSAARFYAACREELGLFEPLTTLQNGTSACAALIPEKLGFANRWEDEFR